MLALYVHYVAVVICYVVIICCVVIICYVVVILEGLQVLEQTKENFEACEAFVNFQDVLMYMVSVIMFCKPSRCAYVHGECHYVLRMVL